ncbi:MAG: metal-sensitive transcriptional regulator [Bacteroidetes Order II. Incertae sedis bacterium]|nr:metal-sensitive transcriptional regulator [Bacteroidetes Order II. bacterium]
MSVTIPAVEWIPLNTQEKNTQQDALHATFDAEQVLRKGLTNRLARIEGHVRSVREMVLQDRPSRDVVLQVQAIKAALNQFALTLLEHELKQEMHLSEETQPQVEELIQTLKMLLKHA